MTAKMATPLRTLSPLPLWERERKQEAIPCFICDCPAVNPGDDKMVSTNRDALQPLSARGEREKKSAERRRRVPPTCASILTDGLNTQNRWTSNPAQIDARTQAVCSNIKAANIQLYTVLVMSG